MRLDRGVAPENSESHQKDLIRKVGASSEKKIVSFQGIIALREWLRDSPVLIVRCSSEHCEKRV